MADTGEVIHFGETQHFECQVIGYPTPSVSWFKDDVDITDDARYNIHYERERGIITLMIKEINAHDEGCYVCRAENSEGYATTAAFLVVRLSHGKGGPHDVGSMMVEKVSEEELSHVEIIKTGRQTIIEEVITRVEETQREVFEDKLVAPQITYDTFLRDVLTLKNGNDLYIEIDVMGYPRPQVRWYRGDELLEETARATMEDSDGWSFLRVKGVTSQDAGAYKAMAENVAGTDTATFHICVQGPPSPPRNLRVVEVYKDYIIVEWDTPEDDGGDLISGYVIDKSIMSGIMVQAGHVDVTTKRFKLTKLHEGHEYYIQVKSENRTGFSQPVILDKPVKARLPFDPPGAPRNLQVTETYKDYIVVDWEAPETDGGSELFQYVVEKRDVTRAAGAWVIAGTVESNVHSYRVSKLFQGNQYLFRVCAENKVGTGQYVETQEPVEAKLPYDNPLAPCNIRATETNRDYIVLAWDAPESDGGSPITGYVLEKRDTKRPGYLYIADVGPNTFEYKATRLFEGYDYYFRVIAENQAGPSEPCEMEHPARAKLPFDEPGAPGNLRVKEYWTDHITITWDRPEMDGGSPITGYIIEKRDATRSSWMKAGSVDSDVLSFKAENLFEGAEYLFRVFAENKVGPSLKAAEMTTPCGAKMPFDPPFAPKSMNVLEYNTDYVILGWEAPEHDGGSPIQRYVIERRDVTKSMWIQAGAVDKDTLKFKVPKLFEGQNYIFRIAAENECGRGKYLETEKPVTAKLPYDKPSAPRNFDVVDVWRDYINLSWEAPEKDGGSPLTGYTIEQRDAYEVGYKFIANVDSTQCGYQATNLEEGHEYYFRIFAQNSAGLSAQAAEIKPPVKARLPFDIPEAPTSLSVTETGPGKISIAWQSPLHDGGSPITSYIIEIRDVMATSFDVAGEVDGTVLDYNLLGLKDKQEYCIRMRAKNMAGVSRDAIELDNPVAARTPIKVPDAPRKLSVLDTDSDRITVEWDDPASDGGAPVSGYQVECCPESYQEFKVVGRVRGKSRSFTIDRLTKGDNYFVRVRAENPAGFSDYVDISEAITANAPVKLPSAPRDLRVLDSSDKHITVKWQEPKHDGGAPITEYIIEMCHPKEDYHFVGHVSAPITEYTIMDVVPGEKYYIRVMAQNSAGVSMNAAELSKPVIAKLPYDEPSPPHHLKVTDTDKTRITVEWEKPKSDGGSQITAYEVEMCSSKDEFRTVGTVNPDVTQYTAEELIEGERYYVRVRAVNAAGTSKMAAELDKPAVAKPSYDVPGTPRKLQVTDTDKDHITVQWAPPKHDGGAPITGYVVEICSTKELDFRPVATVDANTLCWRIDCVNAGEKYYIRVKAENPAGFSQKPAETDKPVAAKPAFDPPSEPRNLTPTDIQKDGFTVEWDKPFNNGGSPITNYVIEMCTPKSDFETVGKVDGETTSYTAIGLIEGERYFVRVRAENPAGVSDDGAEMKRPVVPKTPITKPYSPGYLKVHDITMDSVSLIWEKPESDGGSPVTQYVVEKRELPHGKFEVAKSLPGRTCEAFIGDLKPNQDYAFRVSSENEVGRNDKPAELLEPVKTGQSASVPNAPRNLVAKEVTPESIHVEWEEPEYDGGELIKQYLVVLREESKKKFKKVGKTDVNTLNYIITSNLEEGHEYYIRVYAENKLGVSEEGAEMAMVIKMPAMDVVDASVVPDDSDAAQKAMSKHPEFEEEVEPATGEAIRVAPPETAEEEEEEEFVDAPAAPEEEPKPKTVPSAPRDLSVVEVTPESVTLEWNAPEHDGNAPLKSYIVVMREAEKSKFKKVAQTENGTLSITVTKVKAGHEFYFMVYAENELGKSEESAALLSAVKIPNKGIVPVEQVQTIVEERKPQEKADKKKVVQEDITEITTKQLEKEVPAEMIQESEVEVVFSKNPKEAVNETVQETEEQLELFKKPKKDTPKEISQETDEQLELTSQKTPKDEVNEPAEEIKLEEPSEKQPEFVLAPEDQTIKAGDSLKLICIVKAKPAPDVYWKKGNKKIKAKKKKFKVDTNAANEEYILEIYNISGEDAGEYTIKAVNSAGEAKSKFNIILVSAELSISEQSKEEHMLQEAVDRTVESETTKPLIELAPQPVTVQPGETIRLTCRASGEPRPEIRWLKNDEEITPQKGEKRIKVDYDLDEDFNILKISDAGESDAGKYSVKAENEAGVVTQSVSVNVVEPTEDHVTFDPVTVDEGETVTLKCKIEGDPEPQVKWYKDNKEIKEKKGENKIHIEYNTDESCNILTISEAVVDDAGMYTVKAQNDEGMVSQSVNVTILKKAKAVEEEVIMPEEAPEVEKTPEVNKEAEIVPEEESKQKSEPARPPVLTKKLTPVNVDIGETIELKCNIEGKPKPDVSWFKDEQKLKPKKKDNRIQTHFEEDTYILHIKNANAEDSGTYTVQAKNTAGSLTESVRVTVGEVKEEVTEETIHIDIVSEAESEKPSETEESEMSAVKEIDVDQVDVKPIAPTTVVKLQPVTVDTGGTVVLSCKFAGTPEPEVSWYKNKQKIKPKKDTRVVVDYKLDEGVNILTIASSIEEDSAIYTAKAKNIHGSVTQSASVTVKPTTEALQEEKQKQTEEEEESKEAENIPLQEPDKLTPKVEAQEEPKKGEEPSFLTLPESVTVKEGEIIQLTCRVSGKPSPQIVWSKNGKAITGRKIKDKRIKLDYDVDEDVYCLQIKDASKDDAAEYTVEAKNKVGAASQTVMVDVQEKTEAPKITQTPKNLNVKEGDKISAAAKISGLPEPKATWMKNNNVLSADSDARVKTSCKSGKYTLEVKEVTPDDSGEYTMTAANADGDVNATFTVTVQPKDTAPEFTVKPKPITIKEHDTITISTTIKAKPEPKVTWIKADEKIKSNDRVEMVEDGAEFTLMISDCTLEDGGEYTIKAKNKAGKTSCVVSIVVIGTAPLSEEERDKALIEQLSPQIAEEADKVSEKDKEMLFKAYPMLGNHSDPIRGVEMKTGEIVEVLDADKPDEWLVRKQEDKEKVCYVPTELLLGKPEAEKPAESEESDVEEDVSPEEEYPTYAALANYTPSADKSSHLPLIEGEFVEVIDSKSPEMWLCRQQAKPDQQGWVPPSYLVAHKPDEKLDTRTTQEQFVDEVLKMDNEKQEAGMKRRYALKHLLESEREYIKDLEFAMNNYYPALDGEVPSDIRGKRDVIFSTMPDITPFHRDTFLPDLTECAVNPILLGDTFLKNRDRFQQYVPYFRDRNIGRYLLDLEEPRKFIKGLDEVSEKGDKRRYSLPHYLGRPWNRIDDYIGVLRDFVKYSSKAGDDCTKLGEAIEMLLDLKKQADDMLTLGRIHGYPGSLDDLGPILRHDDFTVWENEPSGKGKERHLFLFDHKFLITKKHKPDAPGELPIYEYKDMIDLRNPNLALNEDLDDLCQFELWHIRPQLDRYTYQARSEPIKRLWCDLLRPWLRKYGQSPEFVGQLRKVACTEGDDAKMMCRLRGEPLPEICWLHNNKPLTSEGPYRFSQIEDTYSLSIRDTTPDMSGRYAIRATNKFSTEESSADLDIKVLEFSPSFTSKMRNTDVLLGGDAAFECKLKAKPAPKVTWHLNGRIIIPDDHFQVSATDDTFTLKIRNVVEPHMGKYECRALNSRGESTCQAQLFISDLEERKKEKKPDFTSILEDTMGIEGMETKLSCRLAGYPEPEVTWLRDGRPIKADDDYYMLFDGTEASLYIKETHPVHADTYTCKVKNRLGTIECSAKLAVGSKPKFTSRFYDQDVVYSEEVTFSCKLRGEPTPQISWYYDKLPITETSRILLQRDEETYKLVLKKVMESDRGEYTVKAVNAAGEDSCSANLFVSREAHKPQKSIEVEYAPRITKKLTNQEVMVGHKAKFVCKAIGEPAPQATWYRNSEEIKPSERMWTEKDGAQYRLIMSCVNEEDQGTYRCFISNDAGDCESTAELLIEKATDTTKAEDVLTHSPPTMSLDKPRLQEIDEESFQLNWTPARIPYNAQKTPILYDIERKNLDITGNPWEPVMSDISDVWCVIKGGYDPYKDYLYRVIATNQYGRSHCSMPVAFYGRSKPEPAGSRRRSRGEPDAVVDPNAHRPRLPPRAPRDKPSIHDVTDDKLSLSWHSGEVPTHALQTPITYVVERRCPPSRNWIEMATDLEALKYTMKDYRPEKDYMFRIRAANEYGSSDPSMAAQLFAKPAEEEVKKKKKSEEDQRARVKPRTIWDRPEIQDLTESSLTLKWKASSLPSYAYPTPIWYTVEQRKPPSLEWERLATNVKDSFFKIPQMVRDKDYYFRIRAENEFGMSEPSMPAMLRRLEKKLEEPEYEAPVRPKKTREVEDDSSSKNVPLHLRIAPEFLDKTDDRQYGVEGKTSKIIFQIRAYPDPTITWYLHGNEIRMADKYRCVLASSGELVLEINKFSWSDVGEYKVHVHNIIGDASKSVRVDMADPPTFLEPMKDQIFHLRMNGKLECRVHGIPYPTVQFKHDWRIIADSHRVKILREEYDHWTLNVQNAIRMDEGLYECVAENVAGKVYCSSNVKVTEKSSIWRDIRFNQVPIEDFFHVIDEVGRGSYGVVRRVIDKNSGTQYAAKFMRFSDPLVKEELQNELEIMTHLDHQNIIQVVDGYEDKKRLVIVMEIVTGGELLQRLVCEDALTESEVAFYLKQLLTAVEYMHSRNVVHMDLKPENIFLLSNSSDELKIIDFGYARKYNPNRTLHCKYATPEFCAPEVASEDDVTPAADLWSVGVISYILLSGISPFYQDNLRDTLVKVMEGKWEFDPEAFAGISQEARDFTSKLLVKDPKKRMTATEALQHPFIELSNHRGLGDKISVDRLRGFIFRRKWERGINLVKTIVHPRSISSYMEMMPAPTVQVETSVPILALPDMYASPGAGLPGAAMMGALEPLPGLPSPLIGLPGALPGATGPMPGGLGPIPGGLGPLPGGLGPLPGGLEPIPGLEMGHLGSRGSRGSLQLEIGAAGMLQVMGPPSLMSGACSMVGSGTSSEWGREYEDEDTWYEFSSAYQTGPDTQLLPSKDTGLSLRMAKYRRSGGGSRKAPSLPDIADVSDLMPSRSVRSSMKERRDLRDLEKEEDLPVPTKPMSRHQRRGVHQLKHLTESGNINEEGFPPIFKKKIKDKAYNVGESCTLRVQLVGNPPPAVSWYRNEELLTDGGRVRTSSSEDGRYSLTVLQTKPHDFGVYKCVARNKYGTVTCRARMLFGDHPGRPGRPHVTKVSDMEVFMIWEEPESDGNSYIQAFRVDWHRPGDERWTIATYCIDECALVKGLKPDVTYRFRVCAINKFGISPYSWASVEIRTKKKGATSIDIDSETKRILLRSRQATSRPSPEASPVSSPFGSTEDLTETQMDMKAKDFGVLDREIHLQENIDPEQYLEFGSEVWRGRFSLVRNVKPRKGKKVRRVAKISPYDEYKIDDSLREYEMLKGVRQEHIVRLHEAYVHDDFVIMIFEKLYGENVARSLSLKNRYDEQDISSIIKQVLDALQFLHHRGITHLNLQPDNVIMQSRRRMDIKLIDFGRARHITTYEGEKVPRDGTAEYMAPEKVIGEYVGVPADIWGVGVLTFILLSGVSPFLGERDEDSFANIKHVRYDAHTLYHNVTKYGLKFIYQTLRRSPTTRLTTVECLDHRWLMLNSPMVKSRKAAIFPTDKLRTFEEDYIRRRMLGAQQSDRLLSKYAEGISWSSDEEDDYKPAASRY